MRSLVFAALVLSAFLTMTASAQVKSVAAANHHSPPRFRDFCRGNGFRKKTPAKISVTAASTQVYRVGPGDVLDIQLSNYPSRNSTLFTVLPDGIFGIPAGR